MGGESLSPPAPSPRSRNNTPEGDLVRGGGNDATEGKDAAERAHAAARGGSATTGVGEGVEDEGVKRGVAPHPQHLLVPEHLPLVPHQNDPHKMLCPWRGTTPRVCSPGVCSSPEHAPPGRALRSVLPMQGLIPYPWGCLSAVRQLRARHLSPCWGRQDQSGAHRAACWSGGGRCGPPPGGRARASVLASPREACPRG